MTLTLLDLYNTAASQEWSMYDNDALSTSELEESLVLAINKSILEIYASYDFPFRERTHMILTLPKMNEYDMPPGNIKKKKNEKTYVKLNSMALEVLTDSDEVEYTFGMPNSYYIKGDKIILSPTPVEKSLLTIDYYTLTIGENEAGEEIFKLKDASDKLTVPAYLEELMKEAIITRTMLNTIASESDENYSAYKKQADKAYKLLIKYSKGVGPDKSVKL